jgi:hypothetical protein
MDLTLPGVRNSAAAERRRTMKNGLIWCIALAGSILMAGSMAAGDDPGVPAYPGAKADAETKEVCAAPDPGIVQERAAGSGLKTTKNCYRTKDPFAKVFGFYKNQKGFQNVITIDEQDVKSATFCKGTCNELSVGTSVALSAPWFSPSTLKMNNDLLIVIIDRKK